MARQKPTIDPQAPNQSASQIPSPRSQFQGSTANGLVDVYYGTLTGDIDAKSAAQELLATAPDTGELSNAEYIYNQVSKLYGNVQLPPVQGPSGNSVKSLVFVSGSKIHPGYGAFHISTSQTDFDRIVVDSMNSSGSYSAGSGLVMAARPNGARSLKDTAPLSYVSWCGWPARCPQSIRPRAPVRNAGILDEGLEDCLPKPFGARQVNRVAQPVRRSGQGIHRGAREDVPNRSK